MNTKRFAISVTDDEQENDRSVAVADTAVPLLIDPTSSVAYDICIHTLQMSLPQYQNQILNTFIPRLLYWNERINLMSRKDCTASTIFTRHILPSLVGGRIIQEQILHPNAPFNNNRTLSRSPIRIIDVGSGGGFPGIPLAILYSGGTTNDVELVLADSITKKIMAVQDMIQQLQLSSSNNKTTSGTATSTTTTVSTYNGRVEEYFTTTTTTSAGNNSSSSTTHRHKFDIVTGRSVTSLPQFCSWVKDLLNENGHLVYWMGGLNDADNAMVQEHIVHNSSIQEYLSSASSSSNNNTVVWNQNCDKRIIIISAAGVRTIAAMVPDSQLQQQQQQKIKEMTLPSFTTKRRSRTSTTTSTTSQSPRINSSSNSSHNNKNQQLAKGEWRKRNDPDQPKQRGYENFQRFKSSSSAAKKSPTTTTSENSDRDR